MSPRFCEGWFVDDLVRIAEREKLPFGKGDDGCLTYSGPYDLTYAYWDALTSMAKMDDPDAYRLLPPLKRLCPRHARIITFQKRKYYENRT